jgi:D-amino peptidase
MTLSNRLIPTAAGVLTAVCALTAALAPSAGAQRPIKVFISVDMEGIGGVVTDQQLGPAGFEYNRFREFMTAEALAAIEGARAAGATQFVVADAHGNMQNLLIERFPRDVTIIRGSPRPLSMMQGIDSSFSAAFFIGYHAATTNPGGVRAHTISSATFAALRINGRAVAESGLNAALAGYYGVPVALISGDSDAVRELRALVPTAEGAVVKEAISFHAAAVMTPEASQALIRDKARVAITRLGDMRAHAEPAGPVRLELTYKNYTPAEMMAYLPGVERVDAHTIRYTGRSILDIPRFIQVATGYRADLTP